MKLRHLLVSLVLMLPVAEIPAYAQTAGQSVVGFLLLPGNSYNGYTCPSANIGPCFVPYGSTLPISGNITASFGILSVTGTNDSLSLTTGGTAQQAIASNSTRKGCTIQNPGTSTDQGITTAENAYVNFGGTAGTTNGSFELLPGSSISCSPNGITTTGQSVSVIAATTGHKLIVWEFN